MLFHIYLFVLLAGIGIGSVEYIRWCERSLPTSADIPPEIALTFDDGPHPVYTKKLLDGLRKRGVKATFFLIGENIEGNEELVKQMAEDGYRVGTVNVSEQMELAGRLGVMNIPTLIVFKDGKEYQRFVGLQSRQTLEYAMER